MELVEVKFTNFKNFLLEIAPTDNQHLKILISSNLPIFLRTLKNYEKLSNEELYKHIIEVTKLKPEDYKVEVVEKLKRYLEYFRAVAKSIQ